MLAAIEAKIMTRPQVLSQSKGWKLGSQKIVFTNGVFDLLHRGHLTYLAQARALGDRLIVGLNSDASVRRLGKGEDRPILPQSDRAFQLASLACVDSVTLFDEDTPASLISGLVPDVLVKGGDYTIDTIVGADTVLAKGGRVEVIEFIPGYSTTELIARIRKLA
ncbi:MAG: D-glycero-beta-D-manno-heptose 1-phosphate adenylyltransferase [Bacteroidota bacterium]